MKKKNQKWWRNGRYINFKQRFCFKIQDIVFADVFCGKNVCANSIFLCRCVHFSDQFLSGMSILPNFKISKDARLQK